MADSAAADPEAFPEASKWFRDRVAVTREEWNAMTVEARRQSFTIAGAQQLDVVQVVMDSLQSAIDNGTPIEKWRASIKEKLGKRFGQVNPSHLTTAFINANQTAYNTGRYYQMSSPAVTKVLPWRRYDSVLDQATSEICKACASTILPHDHRGGIRTGRHSITAADRRCARCPIGWRSELVAKPLLQQASVQTAIGA